MRRAGPSAVFISDACGAGSEEAARRTLETLAFEGSALVVDLATFIEQIGRR
jgi:hypothetical protein